MVLADWDANMLTINSLLSGDEESRRGGRGGWVQWERTDCDAGSLAEGVAPWGGRTDFDEHGGPAGHGSAVAHGQASGRVVAPLQPRWA